MQLPLLAEAAGVDVVSPAFRLHEVDDPIYKVRLCLCTGSEQDFCDDVNGQIPDDPIRPHHGSSARTVVGRNIDGYLRAWLWVSPVTITRDPAIVGATVAHEAVHIALGVFQGIGLTPTRKSEEALTYYVEWVACEALRFFWA